MKLTADSKVLLQGFNEPHSSIHAARMRTYGTNIVAAVTPGLGGQTIDDIPVFDLVEQALPLVGSIDTTIIWIPPYQVLDAALEAIAAGIRQLIILSAGVPPLDMVHLLRIAEVTETLVVGPNSLGIIVPGKVLLGTQKSEFYTPGTVGIVSSSSTITYEVALELTNSGLGQSISVSIGSDAIVGSSFVEWLKIFDKDETTQAIVLIGEPGGGSEEEAGYIASTINKPAVAYIVGRHVPVENFGHASVAAVIAGRGAIQQTAQSKIAAFKAVNVPIAERPSEIPELLKQVLNR